MKTKLRAMLRSYRGYLIYLAVMLAALLFLELGKYSRPLMNWATTWLSTPWKRLIAGAMDWYPWSGAELLVAAAALFLLAFLVKWIVELARKRGMRTQISLRRTAFLVCAALTLYNGFNFTWGMNYYADSFEDKSGIRGRASSPTELLEVTGMFANQLNELADNVRRDENGLFTADRDALYEQGRTLYRNMLTEFPFLDGPEFRPKKLICSELLSYLNLTGFMFPYTGEANLNNHSPVCFLPSTIAHELAHQRGVAPEQEANFVGILACLNSDSLEYQYSGALLAYVHLGNALYSADRALWEQAAAMVPQEAWNDLSANSAYWDTYEETVTAQVSSSLNDGMLKSHGQELGTQSYGAVVDLLVDYFGGKA